MGTSSEWLPSRMLGLHLNNVGGLAFGSLLGTVGAAIFDIVDFTVEIITATGIAPSTNGKLCKGICHPNL